MQPELLVFKSVSSNHLNNNNVMFCSTCTKAKLRGCKMSQDVHFLFTTFFTAAWDLNTLFFNKNICNYAQFNNEI